MLFSIFETRRANVRFGDADYISLRKKLNELLVGECEKILRDNIENYLCLRWDITETVLHDEDKETVTDDYPVLLVEVEIIFKKELRLERRCPYRIVVDNVSVSVEDHFDNYLGNRQVARLIANTLL